MTELAGLLAIKAHLLETITWAAQEIKDIDFEIVASLALKAEEELLETF